MKEESPGFLLIPHSGSVIIFEDSFLVVGGWLFFVKSYLLILQISCQATLADNYSIPDLLSF
jgi:hypothetical protein